MNIDTFSIARDLKASELPPAQAGAIAAAIGRATSEGVAAKLDLQALEARIGWRFAQASAAIYIVLCVFGIIIRVTT